MIIGDTMVGKTSLCQRLLDSKYNKEYIATIGIDFMTFYRNYEEEKYKIQLWDTAGQERYAPLVNCYLRMINIIIIMINLNDENAYNSIEKYFNMIKDVSLFEQKKIIIVGNKKDLEIKANINKIIDFVNNNSLKYIDVSIKNNMDINTLLDYICYIGKDIKQEIKQDIVNIDNYTIKCCFLL